MRDHLKRLCSPESTLVVSLPISCNINVEHVRVQVMAACFEIFSTWDDEYDKLQGLLRDIVKKKKEDMKLAWKVNPTHKRLQARLDQMRKSVDVAVAIFVEFFCNLFDVFCRMLGWPIKILLWGTL